MDVQKDFCEGGSVPVAGGARIATKIADLVDWLRERGVEDVDVVGIATDHCVRATALDAVKAGFRARVRLDYSVRVAPDTTAAAVDDFRQAGIAVSGRHR
ncbi:isochorismatase family protein [Streptomyces sp. NBC_00344]|uniref:isochorismatase family protein n=1 Tax=Streptomyces sp. NBC_00344 TaxID=2975720 RepID=UPI003FA75B1B